MLYLYFKKEEKVWDRAQQTRCAQELLLFALNREYGFAELPGIARKENGKPYFPAYPQIFFNYSHCRKGVLCGVSRAPIGVDMETVRPFRDALLRRACHPKERDVLLAADDKAQLFTRLWVLKEAYLKYTGEGIRKKLSEIDFSWVLSRKIAVSLPADIEISAQTTIVLPQPGVTVRLSDGCTANLWQGGGVYFCACGENPQELCFYG